MTMKEYKVTAGQLASRMSVAKWLLSLGSFASSRSVPKAMNMADNLLGGGEFKMHLSSEEKDAAGDICSFEEILWVNPYVEHFKQQREYFDLRDRGAAGDVESAIAYCKLEVEGKVSHAAMG